METAYVIVTLFTTIQAQGLFEILDISTFRCLLIQATVSMSTTTSSCCPIAPIQWTSGGYMCSGTYCLGVSTLSNNIPLTSDQANKRTVELVSNYYLRFVGTDKYIGLGNSPQTKNSQQASAIIRVNCPDVNECTQNTHNCHSNAICTNTVGSFTCTCSNGYTGTGTSCTDIDECAPGVNYCHSLASCVNTVGSATCTCPAGYTGNGLTCTDFDECASNAHNCSSVAGSCINNAGSFNCTCPSGYSGDGYVCQDIDECTNGTNNCHALANCTNIPGGYICTCILGYKGNGAVCVDKDECTEGGNNCHQYASCNNTVGSFTCACNNGFTGNGTHCLDINECTNGTHDCHDNAICTNNPGSFTCTCSAGYTGTGQNCSDWDECIGGGNNCSANANCTNTIGSFFCTCHTGFTGNGVSCPDINECSDGTHNCHTNANCNNIPGTFSCACQAGYSGDGVTNCIDIDECLIGTAGCHSQAICNNTIGSYTCTCITGYTGNGQVCTDINECAIGTHTCHVNGVCTNTLASYTCACQTGFVGDGYINCTDIDECNTGTHNCHSVATCNNTVGSFICTCNVGYTGNGVTCNDINECLTGSQLCGSNSICTNTVGSHTCACLPGFSGNGFVCSDIDECTSGIHNCHSIATCLNTQGSFVCTCNVGYTGNGTYCTDINECTQGGHNCDTNAQCSNTVGSFSCACNTGFNGTGQSCSDINECIIAAHDCHADAVCTNDQGSFHCTCNRGYTGNGTYCTDVNECTQGGNDCDVNAQCSNNIGSFSCNCNTGFNGTGQTCTDINECTNGAHNCHLDAACTNNQGSFVCTCNQGYTGNGTYCLDVDECTQGGHSCHVNAQCFNNIGSFSCSCNTGYNGTGQTCTDIDECALETHNCHDNGTCNNTVGSFSCACNDGFAGNGTFCSDIDECETETHNCHFSASCSNNVGSFQCTCNNGFFGTGQNCSDTDECDSGTDNCHTNATCSNTIGSFICSCLTGFTGNGKDCIDIDECQSGSHDCHNNAVCINSIGMFSCTCKEGFRGNGTFCQDIEECAENLHNCHLSATCENYQGSFTCNCNNGYQGTGQTCRDTDECTDGTHNCHSLAICSNTIGAFSCACIPNTVGDGVNCTDIDECETMCHTDALCTNLPGSYTCVCKSGFSGDGSLCQDINECTSNTDNCHGQATCANTHGSFTCTCNDGYTGSGVACNDVNECAGDVCDPNSICSNSPGSYSCSCKSGYIGNGLQCADVNECTSGGHNCHSLATCTNNEGSFSCACNKGYTGEGTMCSDVNECSLNTDNCHLNAACVNTDGSFTCTCNTGYAGSGQSCTDIDECVIAKHNCNENADCINTVGSFTCSCRVGYSGDGVTCTKLPEDAAESNIAPEFKINTNDIKVDGQWGSYQSWSSCEPECGAGTRIRKRFCDNPSPKGLGLPCNGTSTQTESCFTLCSGQSLAAVGVQCHDHCKLLGLACSPFVAVGNSVERLQSEAKVTCSAKVDNALFTKDYEPTYNPLTKECAGYISVSSVQCNSTAFAGLQLRRLCNCKRQDELNFGPWSAWSNCQKTCGTATVSRDRKCLKEDGVCSGIGLETKVCFLPPCPIDGGFSDWSAWGACSQTCNGGKRSRERLCNNPYPEYNGKMCFGDQIEEIVCNTHPCPINGAWSEWSEWGGIDTCNKPCEGGQQRRRRTCDNPIPQFGGKNCTGENMLTRICNTHSCTAGSLRTIMRFRDLSYNMALNNPTSPEYAALNTTINENAKRVLQIQGEDSKFVGAKSSSFLPGSVIATFTMFFTALNSYQTVLIQESIDILQTFGLMPIGFGNVTSLTPTIPNQPPSNITVVAMSASSVNVSWQPIPSSFLNVTITAYTVYYRIRARLSDPYDSESTSHSSVLLQNLEKFTEYSLRVLARSDFGNGLSSGEIRAFTLEDAPSKAPESVSAYNTSATTMYVEWAEVARRDMNGVPRGYKVKYRLMTSVSLLTANVPYSQKNTILTNLRPLSLYQIDVCAFTNAGVGPCARTEAMTDKTTPRAAPGKLTPHNYTGLNSIFVSWNRVPMDQVFGDLKHYKIIYRQVQESINLVLQSELKEILVHPFNINVTIDGLTPNSVYEFKALAVNENGDGVTSESAYGATCRCPEIIYTNYLENAPYVFRGSSASMDGVFIKILSNMTTSVCGKCNRKVNPEPSVNYVQNSKGEWSQKETFAQLQEGINDNSHVSFPVYGQNSLREYLGNPFVPLVKHPGVVMLTKIPSIEKQVNNMVLNLLKVWPILVVNIVLLALAGIVIWLLDAKNNPEEFPPYFFSGWMNGMWWAFITMGTLGYGDRTPRGFYAKLFGIIWILTGLVVTAILTGAITSSLTIAAFEPTSKLYGADVSAVKDSHEYRIGLIRNAKVNVRKEYATVSAVIQGLKNAEVPNSLLDGYTVAARRDIFEDKSIVVSRMVHYEASYGLVLSGALRHSRYEFQNYAAAQQSRILEIMEANTKKPEVKIQKREPVSLFDSSSPVLKRVLYICGYILIGMSVIGFTISCLLKLRSRKKISPVESHYDELDKVLEDMEAEILRLQERLETRMSKITYKHVVERLALHRIGAREELIQSKYVYNGFMTDSSFANLKMQEELVDPFEIQGPQGRQVNVGFYQEHSKQHKKSFHKGSFNPNNEQNEKVFVIKPSSNKKHSHFGQQSRRPESTDSQLTMITSSGLNSAAGNNNTGPRTDLASVSD